MQDIVQVIENFILRQVSVVCPACEVVFATPIMTRMPGITPQCQVEADLHRVLPDAALRAALVAMCPNCIHTWWVSAFAPHAYVPQLVVETPDIEYPKKFAHAVLTGRQNGSHALDRAMLALNGAWCARECNQPYEKWLELAGQELDGALSDESWDGNRSRYHYIMGEICRQLGDFHGAVRHYNIVDRRSMLPKQLIDHQRKEAINSNAQPVLLPPHIIEMIFCPKRNWDGFPPEAEEWEEEAARREAEAEYRRGEQIKQYQQSPEFAEIEALLQEAEQFQQAQQLQQAQQFLPSQQTQQFLPSQQTQQFPQSHQQAAY